MRKYNFIFWVYLVLNFIFLQGCHKKELITLYIPEQLRVYSIFQAGSFWIYKNETTGEIDSTFINFPPQFTYSEIDKGMFLEKCVINYFSSIIYSSYVFLDEYRITIKNKLPGTCLKSFSFEPGYIYLYDQYSFFKNINYYDSLRINDKIFYSVMNTQYRTTTLDMDTLTYTFYLAKSVGLVNLNLKINDQDTTWSLLRYHVVL